MYSIAVCDDEREAVQYIASRVTEQFRAKNRPVAVDWYTNPERLEKQLCAGTSYDILLLDIDMPKLNGIELCRRFRAKAGESLIVFISNKEELVFQTFDVQPFRFVRKSRFASEIEKLCQDLMVEMDRRSDKWLRFMDNREAVYSVNIRKLMYVEALGKLCRLVSEESVKEVRIQFNELVETLDKHGFIQIHRSYLVNPYYIYRIDLEDVLLDCGVQLPLSRRRRSQIKEQFFDWSRGVR